MANLTVTELLESGVHFGHRVSRWNPKMKPFIFGKRNLIHIIDLKQTVRGFVRAAHFLNRLAGTGDPILFVATKRQVKNMIASEAVRCDMPFVNERWLGGTLTNFETIRSRLGRLQKLEQMEADGSLATYSKKMIASLMREKRKIKRNLDGIREMKRLPGALVVVDPRREHIAVSEANKLGIPTICIMDTDCDPDVADIVIPANDDALRSVAVLLNKLVDEIIVGRKQYRETAAAEQKARADEGSASGGSDRRLPVLLPADDDLVDELVQENRHRAQGVV
ncbi:MAG: 30S ribosomal protein S2, partial [Planctomycetota bacterium]